MTVLRQFFCIELDGLARIAKRLIDVIACRETPGQVGKPNPNRRVGAGVFHDGYVVRHLSGLQSGRGGEPSPHARADV